MTTVATVAALDIGGTKTAAALVREGAVLARTRAATPAAGGPEAVLDVAAGLVRRRAGAPARFGAGVAGFVDPDAGVVRAATSSIAGWDGTDVAAGLAARLGIPGRICNDVHGFVLGETAYGAAAGRQDVVAVALGTGIGGGVVTGGRLLTGAHGAGAHLGHVVVPQAADLPCPCGAPGHVEAVAAGPAIAAEYARRTGEAGVSLPSIVERARTGDRTASELLARAGDALGTALASVVNAFDPAVVVLGGGAAVAEVLDRARRTLHTAVMPVLRSVPVVPAGLGLDATLIGAATWAVSA